MYKNVDVSHLPVVHSFDDLAGFNLSPDVVWVFDLDKHGFWWGNHNALAFWGLSNIQQLINKDLSADTEGARKRTEQTFVKAATEQVTHDLWTTYPNGQPKVMLMRHVAVLLGPDKHRGIIAFVSEQMDVQQQPENLLFAEAARYTSVAVCCFDMQGKRLFENPAFTQWYGSSTKTENSTPCDFIVRFANKVEGEYRLSQAQAKLEGHHEHVMLTKQGEKRLNVDIRISRHPLSGDFVFLVTEYDVTQLHHTIAELEQAKQELKQLAHYDSLTLLPSIRLTKERISIALLQAKRTQSGVALMFIDLDGFKPVNDCYGHNAGDSVLVSVAERLSSLFRESDTVGRLGGDEFLICLPEINEAHFAKSMAQKVIDELCKAYQIVDKNQQTQYVSISASIGIAYSQDGQIDAERFIQIADEKMYQAKNLGKNRYMF